MKEKNKEPTSILLKSTGPLVVYGDVKITLENGETRIREGATSFCRCGVSKNMPYCDGSHKELKEPLKR